MYVCVCECGERGLMPKLFNLLSKMSRFQQKKIQSCKQPQKYAAYTGKKAANRKCC